MEFIDRERELGRLKRALGQERMRLIVIYGRRRMGKSALLRRAMRSGDVYYEAQTDEPSIQRALLARAIATEYPGFEKATYTSWEALLTSFNMMCPKGSALMLDEFPYMVRQDSSLPSLLQRLMDSGTLRFHLVLCGSSQRMMERMVLGAAEPLYGRADEKMNIGPIAPRHWQKAMMLTAVQTVEEYAVWGGVPRYWVLREDFAALQGAVDELVLDPHGVLADEPRTLFLDEASELAPYSSVLISLAEGHLRYSRLADALGKKSAELAPTLNALMQMHYIEREVPFGENPSKTKKTMYRIADPFIAFYYRMVAPNRSYLALGRLERVRSLMDIQWPMHTAGVWESLCRRAVSGNDICAEQWGMASRWWGTAPIREEGRKTPSGHVDLEFDVVAENLSGDTLLVGECKWTSADYADRLLRRLKEKTELAPFTQNYDRVHYTLFLKEPPLGIIPKDVAVFLPEDVLPLI